MLPRIARVFVVLFVVASVVLLGSLYYTDYKVNVIRFVQQLKAGIIMDRTANLTKRMETMNVQKIMERERQSLPSDNPNLVFLRKFGRVTNLPSKVEISNMSNKELQYIYHSYLDNTDFRCKRKIRMGNVGDGGWEICDDFRYRPIKPCIVYSFGINNDFSFDDDVGKVYGCTVYAFDPSMNKPTHNRSATVRFFKMGISGKVGSLGANMYHIPGRQQWKVETLTGIKTMLHHQNTTLDVLKMDIEHAEWPVLEDALQRGELSQVRQLLVEFHYDFDNYETLRQLLPVLQQIEALGFRRFHTHNNPYGTVSEKIFPVRRNRCYEVCFVNERLARDPSSSLGW